MNSKKGYIIYILAKSFDSVLYVYNKCILEPSPMHCALCSVQCQQVKGHTLLNRRVTWMNENKTYST